MLPKLIALTGVARYFYLRHFCLPRRIRSLQTRNSKAQRIWSDALLENRNRYVLITMVCYISNL